MIELERRLQGMRERDSLYEIPFLRGAALGFLAIALLGVLVLLFQVQTPGEAALWAALGGLAGLPCFSVGRRHARLAGTNRPFGRIEFRHVAVDRERRYP
jgi:hypothetical protein